MAGRKADNLVANLASSKAACLVAMKAENLVCPLVVRMVAAKVVRMADPTVGWKDVKLVGHWAEE